jgi:hypothetical protein
MTATSPPWTAPSPSSTHPASSRSPPTLTWELDPDGDHTLLRFTNTVTQPTGAPGPGDPTAADTSTAAGWHMHLDALATILSGGEFDLAHPEPLYEPVHQAYTEKYGPPPEEDPASHPAAVTDTASSPPVA